MIAIKVHLDNDAHWSTPNPSESIRDLVKASPQGVVWVDVSSPTDEDFARLTKEFDFHPLAIEDAAKRHERPKIDFYDQYLFIAFYSLLEVDGAILPVELDLFVGENYLVTVHDGRCTEVGATAERWRANAGSLGGRGVGFLVYSLLDAMVDGYFPIADDLTERIEELEERIFERFDPYVQRDIFALKRDLISLRRVLAPERDVMNVLVRRDNPILGGEIAVFMQDVYDHILRITDTIDTFRDLLTGALDASLSMTSNRLNKVMKTLTASSIILMSMTLVASVYGMNFVHMPELAWRYGYLWALGLMVLIGVGLAGVFARAKWF